MALDFMGFLNSCGDECSLLWAVAHWQPVLRMWQLQEGHAALSSL